MQRLKSIFMHILCALLITRIFYLNTFLIATVFPINFCECGSLPQSTSFNQKNNNKSFSLISLISNLCLSAHSTAVSLVGSVTEYSSPQSPKVLWETLLQHFFIYFQTAAPVSDALGPGVPTRHQTDTPDASLFQSTCDVYLHHTIPYLVF